MSTIALVGAGEFLEGMAAVDRHLVGRVADPPARVVVLPTAAGPENPRAWTDMGVPHFRRLGAQAQPLLVVDRSGADDPAMAAAIRASNFVYLSGGSPGYLLDTFKDSLVWEAILDVYRQGGVLAGCSAGAMVLGGVTRVRPRGTEGPGAQLAWDWVPGLGLLPALGVAPHFNRMSEERLRALHDTLPAEVTVLGIDEHTAAVGDGTRWTVMGRGGVSLFRPGGVERYETGATFTTE